MDLYSLIFNDGCIYLVSHRSFGKLAVGSYKQEWSCFGHTLGLWLQISLLVEHSPRGGWFLLLACCHSLRPKTLSLSESSLTPKQQPCLSSHHFLDILSAVPNKVWFFFQQDLGFQNARWPVTISYGCDYKMYISETLEGKKQEIFCAWSTRKLSIRCTWIEMGLGGAEVKEFP